MATATQEMAIAYISFDAAELAAGRLNDLGDSGKWVVFTIQDSNVLVSVKKGTPQHTLTWLCGFFAAIA